jgi:xylan 1,4-beta-xylosidase
VWRDDGWLYLKQGGLLPVGETEGPLGLELSPVPESAWNGRFDTPVLDIPFQSLRQPLSDAWLSLTERPGFLRLKGMEPTVSTFRQGGSGLGPPICPPSGGVTNPRISPD